MSKALDFGIQSYCFRNFKDNREVAKMVGELDLDKIEVCRVHADFNDLEKWKEIVGIYRDAGISIVSIGVETFNGNDSEKELFEAASHAGAKHISAHFKVDTFTAAIPKVRAWCREFGIRVGIHCHGGYMFGGQPDVMKHLIGLGQPEIGLCMDTAWTMQIGPGQGNPVEWAKNFASSLYGIHYKDFVFDKNGKHSDTVVGEGTLDLPELVRTLEANNYDGMAVVEYEADPDNPLPALKKCVESMRAIKS